MLQTQLKIAVVNDKSGTLLRSSWRATRVAHRTPSSTRRPGCFSCSACRVTRGKNILDSLVVDLISSLICASFLQMLCANHQDWLPGRHREAVGQEGQTVNEKVPLKAAFCRVYHRHLYFTCYWHTNAPTLHASIWILHACENKTSPNVRK